MSYMGLYAQIVDTDLDSNSLKYGFVDKNGHWIVKPIYEWAHFSDGFGKFSLHKSDKTTGLMDKTGKVIFPQGMYKDYYIDEGKYIQITDLNENIGVLTISGKVIVPCQYKDITILDDEPYIHVKDAQGKAGLLTITGQMVVPCQYEKIFVDDRLIETLDKNKLTGVWTTKGKQIIPCKYQYIWDRGSYIEVGDHQDRSGAYSFDGELLVPCKYDRIKLAAENIFLVIKDATYENKSIVSGKYGYYANGKEIIPCIYDEASVFTNDVAKVKKDGEVTLIKNPLKDGGQIMIAGNAPAPSKKKVGSPAVSRYPAPDSDVDKNIPMAKRTAENTFAFIIANENYPDAPVPYSLNDGRMFREYCQKTLGLPEKNINLYEDATFGNIITAVEKMKLVADAYDGEASVIFYYAGHGFPDDKQATAYLLPIDGDASNITTTGYSLAKLYKEISQLKLKSSVVFLDACFSGAKREDQMLASSRGVAIKVKEEAPQGNMVVFSAAQGDETAHQMEEKRHGLFTYFLLKELQATGGDVDMGTLTEYVTKQVKRQSVVINNKKQTPTVIPSQALTNNWQTMKLK